VAAFQVILKRLKIWSHDYAVLKGTGGWLSDVGFIFRFGKYLCNPGGISFTGIDNRFS
jgi:hypothetical protein